MSTRAPLWPNLPPCIISTTACFASSTVAATTTPLPSASPSALTTIGAPCVSRYASALSISVKVSLFAVGIPYLRIRFLEKILLASICAA